MISLGEIAGGMIAAATAPPAASGRLIRLRLAIPMLARQVPEGDALWATILRPPRGAAVESRSLLSGWFARRRRRIRRRAGWAATTIELYWTSAGIVACVDGRRIARFAAATDPSKTQDIYHDR
ncbi:hypothetical protein FHT00_000529 [Sphingomonas insulae]|uniref:Uncharacterized protein n=1 Tax=Sphingomonas insulae TaxID=424800 RepID=A0ABN1HVV4_9SPHN|nr:hypothetical protein [Sphingomonas insulae]NIJ28601.1 hypothetical protein [Sphingomonas insulae]